MKAGRRTRPILLGLLLSALAGCGGEVETYGPCPPRPAFSLQAPQGAAARPDELVGWVTALADPARRGRRAGTAEAHEVAGLLGATLDAWGLEAPEAGRCQRYPYVASYDFNVVGQVDAGPEAPWILVGAHYDGRGWLPTGQLLPGADDNASGVAALLEIARRLRKQHDLPFSVAFLLLGAEEIGFVGTHTWLARPSIPLERVELMVNLDMVGRQLPDGSNGLGYAFPNPENTDLLGQLERAAGEAGVPLRDLTEWHERAVLLSDSTFFAKVVPSVLFSTGLHEDHHAPGDVAAKVRGDQIDRAVRLVLELLESAG